MWTPTAQQKTRIQDTLGRLEQAIAKHWDFAEAADNYAEAFAKGAQTVSAVLQRAWPGEEFGDRFAELFAFPLERGVGPGDAKQTEAVRRRARAAERLAHHVSDQCPTAYGLGLFVARLRCMLDHPYAGERPNASDHLPPRTYFEPDFASCLALIIASPAQAESVLPFLEDLALGRCAAAITLPKDLRKRYGDSLPAWQLYEDELRRQMGDVWEVLEHAGRFGYETFAVAARLLPGAIPSSVFGYDRDDEDDEDEAPPPDRPEPTDPIKARIERYAKDFAWDVARVVDDSTVHILLDYDAFRGARFLVRACEIIEADPKITRINKSRKYSDRERWRDALGRMARATLDPADDEDALVAQLKQFSPRTLKVVQAVDSPARDAINRALAERTGAKDLGPVQNLVKEIRRTFCGEYGVEANTADPTKGVLDQGATRAILAGFSAAEVKEALALAVKSDSDQRPAVTVIQALMGWNREEIAKGMQKRNQVAVRAYGLLPLPKGEAGRKECVARYLALRQFAKESNQFGQQRRANERGAVQAALANLANTAGYGDPIRLEWAMEARISRSGKTAQEVAVKGASARLEIEDGVATIVFAKNGKPQKTAPAELKKHPDFQELQELAKAMKGQRTRCRAALEQLCADGTPLDPDDLKGLAHLAVGRELAARLLFRTAKGRVGLYDPAAHALSGLEDAGRTPRIKLDGPVTVVHPLDLFASGELAQWQQEIVVRRVVQPFKQAFRELYVLTPAERETKVFSNRFAGHVVRTRILSGLLSTRGWLVDADVNIQRLFPQAGLVASFHLTEYGHYLTEIDTTTSDRVEFAPYPPPRRRAEGEQRVPLERIPPKILSEVLRDVDLFVSVAQVAEGDHGYFSGEQFVKRGELLTAIITSLGLPNVVVDGHFARVKGTRANYRVHLGSAVIHIEPGNYLCIVPDREAKRRDLFLPFADNEDPKLSEVVAKIVLLANDATIKDKTILSQIAARPAT